MHVGATFLSYRSSIQKLKLRQIYGTKTVYQNILFDAVKNGNSIVMNKRPSNKGCVGKTGKKKENKGVKCEQRQQ